MLNERLVPLFFSLEETPQSVVKASEHCGISVVALKTVFYSVAGTQMTPTQLIIEKILLSASQSGRDSDRPGARREVLSPS